MTPPPNEMIQARTQELLPQIGIPERYQLAKLDDFPPEERKMVRALIGPKINTIIVGPNKTGKTHLMAAIARENSHNAFLPHLSNFISMSDLILNVREGIGAEGEKASDIVLTRRYMECPYLYLDDLGAEKTTDWVRQVLYTIINYRYNHMKHILITSNLMPSELDDKLGTRICRRIEDMCTVHRKDER